MSTINRDKAITVIEDELDKIDHVPQWVFDRLTNRLRELPPAQPEIIRCKDCKYGILDCDFPHERYCYFKGNEWNNDDHFCGHAKRREVTE